MLRRLVKASAIVIGVGLAVAACSPVKMGAAAIVGNERITIATLDTEVTNLSQAAARYPTAVNLNASQRTQATLTWLIRYQIFEEMARQAGITVSTAQGQEALQPDLPRIGQLHRREPTLDQRSRELTRRTRAASSPDRISSRIAAH